MSVFSVLSFKFNPMYTNLEKVLSSQAAEECEVCGMLKFNSDLGSLQLLTLLKHHISDL
jgi:hypothetical protein